MNKKNHVGCVHKVTQEKDEDLVSGKKKEKTISSVGTASWDRPLVMCAEPRPLFASAVI